MIHAVLNTNLRFVLDSYIEEEGRPQSRITASLYGEMPLGMMPQPASLEPQHHNQHQQIQAS